MMCIFCYNLNRESEEFSWNNASAFSLEKLINLRYVQPARKFIIEIASHIKILFKYNRFSTKSYYDTHFKFL